METDILSPESIQKALENFQYFPHPLFQTPSDPILNFIRLCQEEIMYGFPTFPDYNNDLSTLLYKQIFGERDQEEVKEELLKHQTSFDTVCGKFIKEREVFFRCLDCDLLKQKSAYVYALLCKDCFEQSSHVGHRILYEQAEAGGSAICDCGDPYSLKNEGFCLKHKNIEINPLTVLNNFPKQILEDCSTALRKAIYGIMTVFELAIKFPAEDILNRNRFHSLGKLLFADFVGFCEMLYSEISSGFLVVLATFFKSTFLEEFSLMWHDCNDYKNEADDYSLNPEKAHSCTCSVLDNILRISNVMDGDDQAAIHKVLLECAKDPQFKIYILERFIKYLPYMYRQNYNEDLDKEGKTNTKLLNMKVQLYGSEELCYEAYKSEYFLNHTYCINRALEKANKLSNELYQTCMDLNLAIGYCLLDKYTIGQKVIDKLNLIEEIFHMIKKMQMKFPYLGKIQFGVFDHEIDYNSLNYGLMLTRTLTDILENAYRVLFKLDNQQKGEYIRKIMDLWAKSSEEAKEKKEEDFSKGIVSFNCVFERSLAFILRYSVKGIDSQKLKDFQSLFIPNVNAAIFAERNSEDLIKSFGMIRYLHLIHNYSYGDLYSVYYFSNNLYFETDIVFIQTMVPLLNKDDIFDILVKNYFSYSPELIKFFRDPQEGISDDRFREKLLTVEDFLDFLIFIMTDELCLVNSSFSENNQQNADGALSLRVEKVFKKLLISTLSGYYWVEGNQVKKDLRSFLFAKEKEFNMTKIYNEVVLVDKKNKKVRVKDNLINKFDPYVFFRNPSLLRKKSHEVLQKASQAGVSVDVVGGQSYTDYPQFLLEIQERILESGLMIFVPKFLNRFAGNYSHLMRPVMKIILMFLEHLQKKDASVFNSDNEAVKFYLSAEFIAKLKEIVKTAGLKDCENCLKRIEDLVTKLTKVHHSDKINEEISEQVQNKEEEKKKLAEQKRKMLEEKFLQKQKLFQEKIASEQETKDVWEENKIQDPSAQKEISCQYCRELIDTKRDVYGIPALIGLANNFYKKQDIIEEGSKEEPYYEMFPVISSCFHYYHENCLKICFHNLRNQNPNLASVIKTCESLCPACKQIFNTFIPFNGDLKEEQGKIEEEKEKEDEEKKEEENIFYTLEKAIFEIANEWNSLINGKEFTNEDKPFIEKTFINRLMFIALEECSKIQDENKFTKFVYLHKKIFEILRKNLDTQNETPSFLKAIIALETPTNDQELIKTVALGILSNSVQDKELAIKNLISEYILFKALRYKALLASEGKTLLEIMTSLTDADFERPEIKPNHISLIIKMLVFRAFFNESKKTEQELLEIFDIIHNNDILSSQAKDDIIVCKQTILTNKQIIPLLEHIFSDSNVLKQIIFQDFTKKIIQLPKSFQDFNNIYTQKKCSLCGEFSGHLMTCLCMICGETICQGSCQANNVGSVYGNLHNHAVQHAGLCVYVNIQNPFWVIVSAPDAWLSDYLDLYTNFLGEGVTKKIEDYANLYDIDFGDFHLSQDLEMQMNEVILENSNRKTLYNFVQKEGLYFSSIEI